ncbi:MAG: hypothetical protein WBO24_18175 [Nitrospirales bacterium]
MPKSQFTTDKQGLVPAKVSLFPSTTYRAEPPERKTVKRLSEIDELVCWIKECVLGDLYTLELGIKTQMAQPDTRLGGGNFLLMAGCLMALEYVARIYWSDKNALTCVRNYTSKFLVPINGRYLRSTEILWRAARNGMLHGSWPQRVAFQDDPQEYKFNIGNELDDPHLTRVDDRINISAPQLLRDIEMSVRNGFFQWLGESSNSSALDRGQPRVLEISNADAAGNKGLKEILSWSVEK